MVAHTFPVFTFVVAARRQSDMPTTYVLAGAAAERAASAEAAAPLSSPQQHQQHTAATRPLQLAGAADAHMANNAGGDAAQGAHCSQHAAHSSRHDASGCHQRSTAG